MISCSIPQINGSSNEHNPMEEILFARLYTHDTNGITNQVELLNLIIRLQSQT